MSTTLPMANASGHTKKITLNAMFFVGYCIGNILGPQVFRASDAPEYKHGYIGLLACLAVAAIAILTYGFLCKTDNDKRDKMYGKSSEMAEEERNAEAFSDMTDREKRTFRYTF